MYSIEACRICLQQKPEQSLKPTSSVNADDGVSFLQHLEYCVKEVNWSSDDFPSLLCDDCIKDLLDASKFKLRCIQSDMYRQKYVKEQSDLKKPTEIDWAVESADEVKEEPIGVEDSEINDICDVELKIDIEEIKVVCNETNECIETQEDKPVCVEQKKVKRVYPSYIDISKCFCSLCNRTFTKKSLWGHVQTIHVLNKKPLTKRIFPSYIDIEKCFCTLCNRTYIKSSLWHHIQAVHSTEKNYKCDFCSEAFTNSTKLNRHRAKHTGKRDHVCYICGKTYLTSTHLKWHLERHENKKQYQCDVCGKGFNVRCTMQLHKRNVHTNQEHYKYQCTQCGQRFYAPSFLDKHMKRHLNLKDYACPLCNKKFVTKAEVEIHRLKHSNVRLNKCEVCGAEYKQKVDLNKHLKKVHGIDTVKKTVRNKRYSCDECPKKFVTKKASERHKNSHVGVKP